MPGEEWVTHLASFHSPPQEEGHPIAGIQFIYWQVKRPDFLDLLCGVVHLRRVVADFLPVCDHIEPVRIDDLQALVWAEVQQGVRAVLQLVLDLLPIEGNHLIEVDFVPVRQAAEKGVRPKHTRQSRISPRSSVFSAKGMPSSPSSSVVLDSSPTSGSSMAKWAVASIIRMGQFHRSSRQSAFVSSSLGAG